MKRELSDVEVMRIVRAVLKRRDVRLYELVKDEALGFIGIYEVL